MSANNQLKSIVERIEKLEEEKAGITNDIKDIFAEAKGAGFDPKILKQVLALRKKDASKRAEEQALLSVYLDALGMLAGTPLGDAAARKYSGTLQANGVADEDDDDDF